MDHIEHIKTKAQRMAIMGLLVETFDGPEARRQFIRGMVEIGAISSQAGELLVEEYSLGVV
jgi:hypothetical protein